MSAADDWGGSLVLDVRTEAEFRRGAYPGAINIPLQELPGRIPELPRDRGILVYCAAGVRSASAVRLLRAAGFVDVRDGGSLGTLVAGSS